MPYIEDGQTDPRSTTTHVGSRKPMFESRWMNRAIGAVGIIVASMVTATGCAWLVASIAFGGSKTAEWIVWCATMPLWLVMYSRRRRSRHASSSDPSR
jgi:hypothetical protein